MKYYIHNSAILFFSKLSITKRFKHTSPKEHFYLFVPFNRFENVRQVQKKNLLNFIFVLNHNTKLTTLDEYQRTIKHQM